MQANANALVSQSMIGQVAAVGRCLLSCVSSTNSQLNLQTFEGLLTPEKV